MRLQLFSDLHADWRAPRPIRIGEGVDVVVVPGDVAEGARNSFAALRRIVPETIPVVFTMGNHEFYRRFFVEELEEARRSAPDFNVIVLENESVVIGAVDGVGGIKFVGATGWVDFRLFGDLRMGAAMSVARDKMNDHKRIGWRKRPWGRFRPQEAAMLHAESRRFIAQSIAAPHRAAAVVVVTHHAPSFRSVPEAWKSDLLTAAYASSIGDDLLAGQAPRRASSSADDLLGGLAGPRVDCWFHGHVHARSDYRIGPTRVLCNPHGYGDEVADFDPCLIVEFDSGPLGSSKPFPRVSSTDA
jgi:3',5'-cyclic AMP phosphodiesterase CpdA